jgi:PKD repeat protein
VPQPNAFLDCNVSGLTVDCVSLSTNVIKRTTYTWSYGDGTGASGKNPAAHTYAAAGSYTITLRVSNGSGKTSTDQTTVSVSP